MARWRSPHDLPKTGTRKRNALVAAVALSLLAFVVQVVGAWYTGSLALLGDTAHLFTDLVSLLMSLFAVLMAARPTTTVKSFGLYRLEVLAAFLNGLLLLFVSASLGYESLERIFHPVEVLALPLLVVAAVGFLLNVFSALVLAGAMRGEPEPAMHGQACAHGNHHAHDHAHASHHDHQDHGDHGHSHSHHHDDRNLSSAFLHVMSDALSSVAVMAGAAAIYFTGRSIFDAVIGLVLSFVVLYWAVRLLGDTVHVLLEGTPRHIRAETLLKKLHELDARIVRIEDLHVWEITSRMYAATAEVKVEPMTLTEAEDLRQRMNHFLHETYGVAHAVLAIRPR